MRRVTKSMIRKMKMMFAEKAFCVANQILLERNVLRNKSYLSVNVTNDRLRMNESLRGLYDLIMDQIVFGNVQKIRSVYCLTCYVKAVSRNEWGVFTREELMCKRKNGKFWFVYFECEFSQDGDLRLTCARADARPARISL